MHAPKATGGAACAEPPVVSAGAAPRVYGVVSAAFAMAFVMTSG